jgi:large subunit ribosomal protein L29
MMTPEEREKKVSELRVELVKLRTMVKAGGKVDNPARVKEIKRTIARLLTVEGEKRHKASKPTVEGEKK